MSDLDLYALFLLGFLGTGHCIGMCGPLVLAIPTQTGRISAHVLYNLGRITTYTVVGACMGGIGAGLSVLAGAVGGDPLAWIARIQVAFSLVASVLLLLLGLFRLGILVEPDWMNVASPARLPGFKRVRAGVTGGEGRASVFLFGLMLGFLPCGLSYAAFARALASGGVPEGGLLLLAFGVGTVPGLFLVGTGASGFVRRYRQYSDLLSGMLMTGIAVSLAADALQGIIG
jgi:sulfite exporter TauE/SafE